MASVNDVNDCESNTDTFCNNVKDSSTEEYHKDPSEDAELDDLLEGTLK